jgi:methionine sulfoxide reductase heme-binding subunit
MAGGVSALHYGWWLASRAAGIVAFALLAASMVSGLVLANRLGSPAFRLRLRDLHEPLAVTGLVAIGLHGVLLLVDPWLDAGPVSVVVPFTLGYRPLWTGLGVLAAWAAAGLGLSFYARRRFGARRWRALHRLVPIAYALAVVHVLGAGSDAGTLGLRVLVLGSLVPVGALLALRLMTRPVAPPPAQPAAPPLQPAAAEPGPPERAAGSLWQGRAT